MTSSNPTPYPARWRRLWSVWHRHFRVYARHLLSNGFPPLLEPLIFLVGVGLGLGAYITEIDGVSYIAFLAIGLPLTAAMFTAAEECSFGAFVRLEVDRTYETMLCAPVSVADIFLGEMAWAGTKGFFFSCAIVAVFAPASLAPMPTSLFTPFVGFLTGFASAALSLLVTSFVRTMNHFSFYFTGILTPVFYFSGVVFPLENLPRVLRPVAEVFPLLHAVRMSRSLCSGDVGWGFLADATYLVAFCVAVGALAIVRLRARLLL